MRCPSCGAIIKKRTMKCPECGAFRNKSWVGSEPAESPQSELAENKIKAKAVRNNGSSSSLITFPGTTRSTVPEWRKELGERVREVQERRARDAALEGEQVVIEEGVMPAPQLELLPKAELPPVNPIVAAALQRIERAHARSQYSGNVAVALQDYEARPEVGIEISLPAKEFNGPTLVEEEIKVNETPPPLEKVHNLAVVPAAATQEDTLATPKPKRLIRDDNDPALNYLDSLPTTVGVDVTRHRSAPIGSRIVSGFVDLFVICLLASPVLALLRFKEVEWLEPRTIAFVVGSFVVVAFLYLTINTALTGRTLGMRLLSLRVVDARTGLIPTGGQSAKRALVYLVTLAPAGIALMYTFIDRERQTPHDRFSRTAVVRV
jgi:uncharacterized RDD family membrane protein YckC